MNLADCLSRCDQWDLVSYIEVKWLSWRHCCPLLFLLLLLLLPAFLYTAGHLPLYFSHLIGCHYSSRPGLITAGLQHETYWLTRGCNLTPLALNPPLTSPFSKLQLDCRRVINAPPSPLRLFNHFLLNQSDISWPGIPVTLFTLWSAIGWGRQGNPRERENILSQKKTKKKSDADSSAWFCGNGLEAQRLWLSAHCVDTQFYFFCVIVETFFF